MTGSIKGLLKRKWKGASSGDIGWEHDVIKGEGKQWEKRGKKFDMTPDTTEEEETVMPMADEEEIKRSKRRANSARGGGRASTVLTEGDKLGP